MMLHVDISLFTDTVNMSSEEDKELMLLLL